LNGKPVWGLFRGSELPRLVVLAAILMAGWSYAVWRAVAPPRPEPPKPPTAGQLAKLPPPDDSIELQGVQDKERLTAHESLGYAMLVRRARETPSDKLAAASRHDVVISQIITRPARYRGLPIHLEGTARRVLSQEADGTRVFPKGKFYEAYVFTTESYPYPYIFVFEDAPSKLPVGADVWERLAFEGYFFKLMPYIAGDKPRFAPLLIGRVVAPSTAPVPQPSGRWQAPALVLLLTALTAYLGLRLYLKFRQAPRPGKMPEVASEPMDVSAWLEQGPRGS
jgi:hypothetical protein